MSTREFSIYRVTEALSPEAPAVGIHWSCGRDGGFLPEPAHAGTGACWTCKDRRHLPTLPVCAGCAELLWGCVPQRVRATKQETVDA